MLQKALPLALYVVHLLLVSKGSLLQQHHTICKKILPPHPPVAILVSSKILSEYYTGIMQIHYPSCVRYFKLNLGQVQWVIDCVNYSMHTYISTLSFQELLN